MLQITAFAEQTINRIKARAPGLGSDLPPLLNFFGQELKGPNGFMWNLIPFYHQDMKFDGAKLEAIGLPRSGWTGTSSTQLPWPGAWDRFMAAVGPEGEFIRLGWSPGMHPRSVLSTPMSPQQYHSYVKAVNEIEGDGMFVFDGMIVADLEGLTLKDALKEIMATEAYWMAPDDLETSGSKKNMIVSLVSKYRHTMGKDFELGIGGADLFMFETDPEMARRILKTRERRFTPEQLERREERLR